MPSRAEIASRVVEVRGLYPPVTGSVVSRETHGSDPVFIQHGTDSYSVEPQSYLVDGFVQEARRGPQEGLFERVAAARHEATTVVRRLLTPDNRWQYGVEDGANPYDMSLAEVDSYMDRALAPIYDVVDTSLNQYRLGFNTHDAAHAKRVNDHALVLLQEKGVEQDVLRRTVIASLAHDIGNLVSRDMHAIVSPRILAMSMPALTADRTQWERIQQAIRLHDSDLARMVIARYGSTPLERIVEMRKRLHPETLAIMVADKLDNGPERVSNATSHMATIDHDPHIFINNLGFMREVRFLPREVIISMDYNPKVRKRNQDEKPNFMKWQHTIWAHYPERFEAMSYALFALFPHVRCVSLEFNEAIEVDGARRVENSATTRIYAENIDAKIRSEYEKVPAIYKQQKRMLEESNCAGC